MERRAQRFVKEARVARMGTVDAEGRPRVLPICFSFLGTRLVSVLDEKPKSVPVEELARVRQIRRRPFVCVTVDRYSEDWDLLGWVQLRGSARVESPDSDLHRRALDALRKKYNQYRTQALSGRPVLVMDVDEVASWGNLRPPHEL